jgi:hypothetical protein
MLTIFACPKPFTDPHIAIIQRNAITSWTLLRPRPEIILFADEPGTAEICRELGLRHVPEVARDGYGTPLLNSIFEAAQNLATHDLLCYVNSDIILLGDFIGAIETAQRSIGHFLLSGGRWDLELRELLDWTQRGLDKYLSLLAQKQGMFRFFGNDYFVFPRGLYKAMPCFAIGRGWFDGWLIWYARSVGVPVIDASRVVTAIHQNHNYAHANAKDDTALWASDEARHNFELAGIRRFWFLLEATHELTPRGVRRVRGRKALFRIREILVYRLGRIRAAIGLRRSNWERVKGAICGLVGRCRARTGVE